MMTHKIIYISGKVSGEDYEDVYSKFRSVEIELRNQNHRVVNPVEILYQYNRNILWAGGVALNDEKDRKTIMKMCINNLMDCDAIYLLPDWQQSQGAILEATIAKSLGLEVINTEERISD